MGFEWDEQGKAGINFLKHGVRIPEAIPVFEDPCAVTITDNESDPDEERFVTLPPAFSLIRRPASNACIS